MIVSHEGDLKDRTIRQPAVGTPIGEIPRLKLMLAATWKLAMTDLSGSGRQSTRTWPPHYTECLREAGSLCKKQDIANLALRLSLLKR